MPMASQVEDLEWKPRLVDFEFPACSLSPINHLTFLVIEIRRIYLSIYDCGLSVVAVFFFLRTGLKSETWKNGLDWFLGTKIYLLSSHKGDVGSGTIPD